jgi:hypothetical protein
VLGLLCLGDGFNGGFGGGLHTSALSSSSGGCVGGLGGKSCVDLVFSSGGLCVWGLGGVGSLVSLCPSWKEDVAIIKRRSAKVFQCGWRESQASGSFLTVGTSNYFKLRELVRQVLKSCPFHYSKFVGDFQVHIGKWSKGSI